MLLENAIGKRPADDDLEIVRKSKLLKSSPSDMGKPSAYKSLQKQSSQRIWDDRPEADTIPPLSLLYRGFGHFMDHSGLEPHSTICVDSKRRDLERNIDHFATEMSKFYENEAERMVKGLDMINAILGRTLMAASVGSRQFHTDGHYLGPHNAATCVVEFKNEVAEISSIAMVELTAYIGQLHKQSLERHGDSLMGWNLPCLGMTIIGKLSIYGSSDESNIMFFMPGPYITFYGVIFLGQWRTVSLTPTLSCMASGSEGKDREALYAAFSGALDLLRCIDGDAQQFKEAHPTFPHEDRKFPYISELPRFPATSENKKVQFRILKRHPDIQDYRHLYIAKTSDEKDIIVKFTRRYSIELHAFCAESGHAPGLLGFGTIPGGWFGIAMDYISTAVNPSHSHLLNDLRTKWTEDLQQLVKSFHNKNLVHGDLRVPNMICKEEQIMLVDFDWGGRVGEASYPTANLNPELTIGRGNTDRGITMDDDNRILTNTLNNL